MTPDQLIYSTIRNKCSQAGLDKETANRVAEDGLIKYKQNTFCGKPIDLIEDAVKEARKACKAKRSKNK